MIFKRFVPGSGSSHRSLNDRGLIIFPSVEEALRGERVLKKHGFQCKLVAPPPALRQGCDLALEVDLIDRPALARALQGKVPYVGIYPLEGSAELPHVLRVVTFPHHVMVKVGNMKLVFDKSSGIIVNISGGGCPDVPYLYIQLVGGSLDKVPRPQDIGYSLCAAMLDRAWEEALAIWKGEKLT